MITKLYVKKQKGEAPTSYSELYLQQDLGAVGDCHATGGDRAICLVTEKTMADIEKAKAHYPCLQRFSPNIVLSTEHAFVVGDIIYLGEAELSVRVVGRACHKLCDLPHCALVHGAVFAAVTKSGTIHLGESEHYA